MRVIILTQGQHTVVDDDVYEWASKFKWYAVKSRQTFYAARRIRLPDGTVSQCLLHREILKAAKGVEVDHWDNDGLNNLCGNLRICSRAENSRNCPVSRRNNTSGYKGVEFVVPTGKWRARIQISGRLRHLGCFGKAVDAAKAYDRAALIAFGQFAKINFSL